MQFNDLVAVKLTPAAIIQRFEMVQIICRLKLFIKSTDEHVVLSRKQCIEQISRTPAMYQHITHKMLLRNRSKHLLNPEMQYFFYQFHFFFALAYFISGF